MLYNLFVVWDRRVTATAPDCSTFGSQAGEGEQMVQIIDFDDDYMEIEFRCNLREATFVRTVYGPLKEHSQDGSFDPNSPVFDEQTVTVSRPSGQVGGEWQSTAKFAKNTPGKRGLWALTLTANGRPVESQLAHELEDEMHF